MSNGVGIEQKWRPKAYALGPRVGHMRHCLQLKLRGFDRQQLVFLSGRRVLSSGESTVAKR